MNDQFRDFIELGAKTIQTPVIAPHAAIMAILAAKIGNLNDSADEDMPAEAGLGGLKGALMPPHLCSPCGGEHLGSRNKSTVDHTIQLPCACGPEQTKSVSPPCVWQRNTKDLGLQRRIICFGRAGRVDTVSEWTGVRNVQ